MQKRPPFPVFLHPFELEPPPIIEPNQRTQEYYREEIASISALENRCEWGQTMSTLITFREYGSVFNWDLVSEAERFVQLLEILKPALCRCPLECPLNSRA